MRWLPAVEKLRTERRAGVLVTLMSVRGHAPREAGSKMVVAADATWDSIGGGNVEATAIERARELLASGATEPATFTIDLSDKAPGEHGVQCCGGEVTVLLEPLGVRPAAAIFGVGHVGLELARILARHDLDLHLVDSRPGQLTDDVLAPLADADARVHVHHEAVLPELVLAELPAGIHVLVMTPSSSTSRPPSCSARSAPPANGSWGVSRKAPRNSLTCPPRAAATRSRPRRRTTGAARRPPRPRSSPAPCRRATAARSG
jgi:xanthine dehydrogenase accessory factor